MTVYPIDAVRERAQKAAASGVPMLEALPVPADTEAGRLFLAEYQAARAAPQSEARDVAPA